MLHFLHRHVDFPSYTPTPPRKSSGKGMKAEVGHLGLCHPVLWVWNAAAPVPSGSGKYLLAHSVLWGEILNPLMLPLFCLGHVPRSLAQSVFNSEPGPLKSK